MKPSKSINETVKQSINNISISNDELKQLAQAREQALAEPKNSFFSTFTHPVLAYASVFLVIGLVTFSLLNNPDKLDSIHPQINDEFAFMTSPDDVEMYQDLEFYMWLEIESQSSKEG